VSSLTGTNTVTVENSTYGEYAIVGTEIVQTCVESYHSNESGVAVCLANGTWANNQLVCERRALLSFHA